MTYQYKPGGTVVKDKRNGHWIAIAYYPDPQSGQRKRKTHSTLKKADAQKWLREQLTRLEAGLSIDFTKLSVAEYFAQWLEDKKTHVAPNTFGGARTAAQHLIAVYGKRPLATLTPLDLSQLYRQLGETKSTRTVRYLHTVIHEALAQAVAWGFIPTNVADRVTPPRLIQKERQPLQGPDLIRFKTAIAQHPLKVLWLFLILTGVRRGEALGLRWSDIDWDAKVARIQQTWIKGLDGPTTSKPKTKRSQRAVALSAGLLELLQDHHQAQLIQQQHAGDLWQNHELVFCREDGSPFYPDGISKRFKRILHAAGLPESTTLHDLRHTHATLLLGEGIHPKVVSERLGHSTVAITLDLYSHMVPGLQEEAASRADAALASLSAPTQNGHSTAMEQP